MTPDPRTAPTRRDRAPGSGSRALATGLLLVTMAQPAVAQDGGGEPGRAELEPVVVVATKRERPIREVAGKVTVVPADTLELQLATGLEDAFRYVPGIDATRGGTRFGTEGLIVRGIAGNRVAMELDGAPLPRQFAVGNFSNATRDLLDAGLIQRVEVLHGPASALYGSAALGGVVSMSSLAPADLVPGTGDWALRVEQGYHGDDESLHGLGVAAWQGASAGLLGAVARRRAEAPEAAAASGPGDERDDLRDTGLARLTWEGPGGGWLGLSLYSYTAETDTDIHSVLGSGRFAATTRLEGEDQRAFDMAVAEYRFGSLGPADGGLLRVFAQDTGIRQDTVDERSAAARPVRVRRRFEYDEDATGAELNLHRAVAAGGRTHRLGLGLEWTATEISELRDGSELDLAGGELSDVVLGESFPLRDFPASDLNEVGAFVQDEVDLGPVTLIGALRWDRYELDPDPDAIYLEDNPATLPVAIRENEISPKLGLLTHLGEGTDLYLQYAHGFRSPTFEDANIGLDIPLFNIRAIPNPDLRPETSDGLEAGLRWRGPAAMRAGLNLFYTRYEDFIESKVNLGPDPASGRILFQSRNIGEARIYGAELEAGLGLDRLLAGLRLDASAFWATGENEDTGEPLNSVGPAQAVLGLRWDAAGGRTEVLLAGTFTLRHDELDESRGALFEAPGHGVLDLFVRRRLGRQLDLRLGLTNILDKTWWHWADVRGLAPDDPLIPLLSQPGRAVALRLRWEFGS